ncbi:hypothetical protein AC579_10025 [Pseudocercospora musae]|uniref:Uncharacterized protein n=1 Tax=Pseudocercospora musae TaxID=113226 RepID=A0A139IH22_9PEZI|nr:hypothetical protein AC579_10025 [Pseudocercospora musae]
MAVDGEVTSTCSALESNATSLAKREQQLSESDLDPAAFLKSVRELSEKREREDAERFRKLEEEVQKGRQERAARRAERARSISPEKQQVSPPKTSPISPNTPDASLPPIQMTPPSISGAATMTTPQRDSASMEPEKKAAESVPDFKGFGSIKRSSTTASNTSRSSTPPWKSAEDAPTTTATGLARSGTLTWNRRPQSQTGGSRPQSQLMGGRPQSRVGSRPQSMVASKADDGLAQEHTARDNEPEPSREQIAASLGTRDPTWFRQTADRGAGNAAFRKSKDEAQPNEATPSGRRGLPGMSRESTIEPDPQISPDTSESIKSDMSRAGSVRGSVMSAGSRYSATSTSSGKPDLKALLAEDEGQQRASPSFDQVSVTSNESSGVARTLTMSSSQARLTNVNDRPVSPTKGMGGFVQSAMMKRTDSQTKRWSAQPGASLGRQNSIASGHGGLQGSHSMPKLEPAAGIKESAVDQAKPTSSSNHLTKLVTGQDNDGFIKPALPSHGRSKSTASSHSAMDDTLTSPGSPSKRFRSPTKSSWIESSLTRPESPKQTPAKNTQPSWMADLANRNAQRASEESTPLDGTLKPAENQGSRPASPTKQTPFGQQILRRSGSRDLPTTPASITPSNKLKPLRLADKFDVSPAPTPKPKSTRAETGDVSEKISTPDVQLDSTTENQGLPSKNKPQVTAESTVNESEHAMAGPKRDESKSPAPSPSQTPATPESQLSRNRSKSFKSPPPPALAKPSLDGAPKMPTDFRSQLKSRAPPAAKPTAQPEFLAKFGQLRKATTEKYVAPDIHQANILRGKSDLTQTAGPVKTQRRDELKESLLAKKDDMKKAKEEGRDLPGQAHERKISAEQPKPPIKPEALARRELLGRSDRARSAAMQSERTREGTPEALARHKSLKSREIPPKASPMPSPKEFQTEFSKPALTKNLGLAAPLKVPASDVDYKDSAKTAAPKESERSPVKKPAQRSMVPEPKLEPVSRQTSSTSTGEIKPANETSKIAARFNPGLASMLARGPPAQPPSRSETPVTAAQAFSPPQNAASEPPAPGAPLNDMRKDRARGPKRRKGATKQDTTTVSVAATPEVPMESIAEPTAEPVRPQTPPKDKGMTAAQPKSSAPPGSIASLMNASLNKSPRPLSFGPYGKEDAAEPPATPGSPATKPHQVDSPPLRSPPFKKPQGARAFPGSRDSLMKASTEDFSAETKPIKSDTTATAGTSVKPETIAKTPALGNRTPVTALVSTAAEHPAVVPEFKGFGASRAQKATQPNEEDKENSSLPSVKAATSLWGRRTSPQKAEAPSQIQLPTKKDEEAAMRSAGLLAASPKPGLGISVDRTGEKPPTPASAGAPPKPLKSSRSVSGLLGEASPNKGDTPPSPDEMPKTEAGRLLVHHFKQLPRHREPLTLDTSAIIIRSDRSIQAEPLKTLRRNVALYFPDGSSKVLPPQQEYTFYDEAVFLCTHTFVSAKGSKTTQLYLWAGSSAFETTVEAANVNAKRTAREHGSASICVVRQGQEPAALLDALGGILITRRGSAEIAPKLFMLCGRKHMGHIVFDEVDFSIDSLCAGFAYLISYPVTLQETKLYLWKGLACSTEELSGARLAAMDLSETGEIIEVDGGVEFTSFLKIFGANTTKWNVPKPSAFWLQKSAAPDKFHTRLMKIGQAEASIGLLSALWNRRPSWNSLSPARSPSTPKEEVKVEVRDFMPFMQSQLEAEGLYLLDGHCELYLLIGPLFATQPANTRNAILGQALLFASDYAIMSASMEDRAAIPKCWVVFSGVPRDVKMLFRHWDEGRGLWGTASLMAGDKASSLREVNALALEEVLNEVCRGNTD